MLVGLAVALLFVVLIPAPVHEPVYEGKPLRYWLTEFDYGVDSTNRSPARHAIQSMGTNALPFLIRYLRVKDPPFYSQWLTLKKNLRFLRFPDNSATAWHLRAALACWELSQNIEPAIPALAESMNDPRPAQLVGGLLSRKLPQSASALTNVMATGNATARAETASSLQFAPFHPEAEVMARTALLRALHDPESKVRATAAFVFSFWNDHLEEIIPAVADMVSDPDPNVRSQADRTLIVCSLGSKIVAKLAVPKLRQLLHDDNKDVRKCAAEVLRLIDR